MRAGNRRIAQLERQIARYESWIGPLRRSPVWPVLRLAKRVRRPADATANGSASPRP